MRGFIMGDSKMKHSARLTVFLLLLMVISSACATTGINMRQINLISSEEEVNLGKNLAVEVEKEQKVLDNPALTSYVNRVGQKVAAQSDRRDISYSFKIIDNDKEVNAFALPGGPVYINSALLKSAENEAELAGVLGHEIAHVAARHSTEQLTKQYGLTLLTQIVLGENPGATAEIAGNMLGSLGMLKFSRNDEIEADRLGVRYMFQAGYSPNAMLRFQEKLGELQKQSSSRVANLLSTHPLSQQRIDAVKQEIAKLPPGRQVEYFTEEYRAIVERELK